MPEEVELTAGDLEALKEVQALGLSADEIKALVERRGDVAKKARALEVRRIINSVQGIGDHPGVVQIEGTRHYPVVALALEAALQDAPEAISLSADDEGVSPVDVILLSVVNAIPVEGRLRLEQPAVSRAATEKALSSKEELQEADYEKIAAALR